MLRFVLILVLIGIFAVAGLFMFRRIQTTGRLVLSAKDVQPTIAETNPGPPIIQPFQKKVGITATQNGFDPETLTTEPFITVVWKNDTGETIYLEHYPEEGQQLYGAFKSGDIPAGETYSFEFYFRKTYRYHDRYHPERIGNVIVK